MRARWLSRGAILVALVGCGALNKSSFSDSQDACLRNAGQCQQDCASWFAARVPSNDYECEALALAQSSAAVNGHMPNVTPAWVKFHIAAMGNLCADGIASGCAMRDSLQQALDRATANREQRQADDARAQAVQAKLANAKSQVDALPFGTPVPGFPEHFATSQAALRKHDLDTADQQADLALQDIQDATTARQSAADAVTAKQRQVQNQAPAVQAATTACDANPADCKARCDGGDGPSCFAWGNRLWHATPPKFADARAAMSKGCDGGTVVACMAVPSIDTDIQVVAAKLDDLWASVTSPVGEVTGNTDKANKARALEPQMAPGSRIQTEMAIQRMMAHSAALVREQYCPAKKAFIAQAGAAEFAKRSAAYIKDSPEAATVFGAACP